MATIAQQQRHRVRAYHQRRRWLAAARQRREQRQRDVQATWGLEQAWVERIWPELQPLPYAFYRIVNARMLAQQDS